MNLQAIYLANIVGFLLIAFLFLSRYITRTKSVAEERIFTIMMWLALVACLIEPLTFAMDGHAGIGYRLINLLGNTYLYFANGFGSFLFCMYVDQSLYHDKSRILGVYKRFVQLVAVLGVALVLNLFLKFFFYVDADGVYHRQPFIYIFYIYMFGCAAFSIYIVYKHREKFGSSTFFPVYMYLIPIVCGSVLQMFFYGISLAWLGTAIGVVSLYMSLQNQKLYMDTLTGLYNRQYLEHILYSIQNDKNEYYGIMLDMNYFKQINDTYGHSAGDRALVEAAEIFRVNAGRDSYVFRYAGDEFIILVKTDVENDVKHIERVIRSECEKANERGDEPFILSVSMGHSRFDREHDDEDTFLKRIDGAMYVEKEKIHAEQKKQRERQEAKNESSGN